jgi:beta-lactamase superfamily II metal-dependent hydrolase
MNAGWTRVEYRGRKGEMKKVLLTEDKPMEMYFLDVGQGDAAFIVSPKGKKILIDGGIKNRALGFLVWKYRLDKPGKDLKIDYLILSHADSDHLKGLIPVINHPRIKVKRVLHNGIGVFKSGYDTKLGDFVVDEQTIVTHDSLDDLDGMNLSRNFENWIKAVRDSKDDCGTEYESVDSTTPDRKIDSSGAKIEFLGPIREDDGQSVEWFRSKKDTINGNSVVVRLVHNKVRAIFPGDINKKGSDKLLTDPVIKDLLDAHVFKAPHHGSHEYRHSFLEAVKPIITVVSSGDEPDYGHPRALFLGAVGYASRSKKPLLFSTEIARTFKDEGDPSAVVTEEFAENVVFDGINYYTKEGNELAHNNFKMILPGIINVRTDGKKIYAMRRVDDSRYQWESYGGITPIDRPEEEEP